MVMRFMFVIECTSFLFPCRFRSGGRGLKAFLSIQEVFPCAGIQNVCLPFSTAFPHLDGILITHTDNDHFSVPTCQHLMGVCKSYHAPGYVAEAMAENGLPGTRHAIGEKFSIGQVEATPTPVWHNWQNGSPDHQYREWKREDYCGYWLDTPDGTIWLPEDSKLLPEHLEMPQPDVILFDFSDNDWHIGLEGAVKLANAYPDAKLLCIHWGTVDAPDFTPFNADPQVLLDRVVNPERILALAPGQVLTLGKRENKNILV